MDAVSISCNVLTVCHVTVWLGNAPTGHGHKRSGEDSGLPETASKKPRTALADFHLEPQPPSNPPPSIVPMDIDDTLSELSDDESLPASVDINAPQAAVTGLNNDIESDDDDDSNSHDSEEAEPASQWEDSDANAGVAAPDVSQPSSRRHRAIVKKMAQATPIIVVDLDDSADEQEVHHVNETTTVSNMVAASSEHGTGLSQTPVNSAPPNTPGPAFENNISQVPSLSVTPPVIISGNSSSQAPDAPPPPPPLLTTTAPTTPLAFPSYTDLVLDHNKLADLQRQTREVALTIKTENTFDMPHAMMWDHPMPHRLQRDALISRAVQLAAVRVGYPLIAERIRADQSYERLIIQNTTHRVSNFRGSLKDKAATIDVLSKFDLQHVHGSRLASAVLSLTTPAAANDDNYPCVYPFVTGKPDLTKPFCNGAIVDFLKSAFFHGPRTVCMFLQEYYTSTIATGPLSLQPELPLCMVAFGSLVV
ncbi:hypothetical protein OF83DRAFT_1177335 [Amylostereum chailletii]|nr:hypothetical protein OF83DRAFT_1177335 [Amylostereum chailletii]